MCEWARGSHQLLGGVRRGAKGAATRHVPHAHGVGHASDQVAAGAVAVGLEGGETRDVTYFGCAFEFNLTY